MIKSTKTTRPYIAPEMEELDISLSAIICTSPDDGGSEDIGYENWNI